MCPMFAFLDKFLLQPHNEDNAKNEKTFPAQLALYATALKE